MSDGRPLWTGWYREGPGRRWVKVSEHPDERTAHARMLEVQRSGDYLLRSPERPGDPNDDQRNRR